MNFQLKTDPGSKIVLPGSKKKINSGVEILTRDDGTVSRPDAVLHGTSSFGEIVIVCDAKYYTNEVPEKVILKTLDDMRLRNTPYGILICSQNARTQEYRSLVAQNKCKNLELVKLRPGKPTGSHKDNEEEYMPEYLTEKNATILEAVISDMIDDHSYTRKKASYKKINPS